MFVWPTDQPTNKRTCHRGARTYLKIRRLKLVVKDENNALKYRQCHVGQLVCCVDCQTFAWRTNRLTNGPTDKQERLLRCVSALRYSTSMFANKWTKDWRNIFNHDQRKEWLRYMKEWRSSLKINPALKTQWRNERYGRSWGHKRKFWRKGKKRS